MIYIAHRKNTSQDLKNLPIEYGIEIDLRSILTRPGKITLSHDPWKEGEDFESWLQRFKDLGFKGPLILNTKEDGLEERSLELLQKHSINNFFFLDTAFPTLVKYTQFLGNKNFALRVSSFEESEKMHLFSKKADWVWVDCFEGKPMNPSLIKTLKKTFKICLVSPELQGTDLDQKISSFYDLALLSDAICTKTPEKWEDFLKSKKP